MRTAIFAAALTFALPLFAASNARADSDLDGAAYLELRVVHTDLPLGGASFSGTGADSQNYVRSFSANGAQIGFVDPHVTLYEGALGLHAGSKQYAGAPQFAVAMILGGGSTSADATGTGGAPFPTSNALTVFRGGFDIGAGAYLGPLYAQASVFLGGASVWTDIQGLGACAARGCTGQAYAGILYFQPRLALQLELPGRFTLGGYVGDNLVHSDSVEAGLTLGVRLWEGVENRWSY